MHRAIGYAAAENFSKIDSQDAMETRPPIVLGDWVTASRSLPFDLAALRAGLQAGALVGLPGERFRKTCVSQAVGEGERDPCRCDAHEIMLLIIKHK